MFLELVSFDHEQKDYLHLKSFSMTVAQIYFGSLGYIGESISKLFSGAAHDLPMLASPLIFIVVFILTLVAVLVIF